MGGWAGCARQGKEKHVSQADPDGRDGIEGIVTSIDDRPLLHPLSPSTAEVHLSASSPLSSHQVAGPAPGRQNSARDRPSVSTTPQTWSSVLRAWLQGEGGRRGGLKTGAVIKRARQSMAGRVHAWLETDRQGGICIEPKQSRAGADSPSPPFASPYPPLRPTLPPQPTPPYTHTHPYAPLHTQTLLLPSPPPPSACTCPVCISPAPRPAALTV